MEPEDEELVAHLLRRAREAQESAVENTSRAEILTAFVRRFREHPFDLPLRCAWCGRIEVDGRFVAAEVFLSGEVPARLRERMTHGICPDCFERAEREASERRAADGD